MVKKKRKVAARPKARAAAKKRPAKAPKSKRRPARPAAKRGPARKPVRRAAAPVAAIVVAELTEPPTWLAPDHAPVDDLTSSGNELLDIFQRYDRNRSGYIERAEFARLLEGLGQEVTEDELQVALEVVDPDSSGNVTWETFRGWWLSR